MEEFTDRVALVTGANRGIGLEVARQLALRGFNTILGAHETQSTIATQLRSLLREPTPGPHQHVVGQVVQ